VSAVTTHVLDTARGRPAAGIDVVLERPMASGTAEPLATGRTNEDGRVDGLGPDRLEAGVYRLRFATAAYFADLGQQAFYPEVVVVFRLSDPDQHYHLPVLLSPFSYSTYRGS
jgi:5-hydroxyisourate hydrolase